MSNSSNANDLQQNIDGSVAGLLDKSRTASVVAETLTLAVLWLLSLLGNVLVCLVVQRSRRIQSTTNFFVVALAVSDLCLTLGCLPFVAAQVVAGSWPAGSFLCKVVRFVQFAAPATAIFVLVSICIDRFYTIIYPLSFRVTRGTAKRMIAFCWLAAAALSGFCFYFFQVLRLQAAPTVTSATSVASTTPLSTPGSGADPNAEVIYVCPTFVPAWDWAGKTYGFILVLCQFVLPTFLAGMGYWRVVRYIWTTGVPGVRAIHRTANPVPRTKVKAVKMLLIVTLFSFVMLAPLYITQMVYCFQPLQYLDGSVFIFAFWLLVATGVTRPLLYVYYNANFRRGCKEVFCMSAMKCYRSSTYAVTTTSSLAKRNHVGVMELSNNGHRLASESPLKAFNRAQYAEKNAWPLHGGLSSTYV